MELADELTLLLQCSGRGFSLGEPADFYWHLERPGSSMTADTIGRFRDQGWVTLHEVVDPDDGRTILHAVRTPAANSRIGELNDLGVKPSRAVDADDEYL